MVSLPLMGNIEANTLVKEKEAVLDIVSLESDLSFSSSVLIDSNLERRNRSYREGSCMLAFKLLDMDEDRDISMFG